MESGGVEIAEADTAWDVRGREVKRQLMYYSQLLYRGVLAYLLFLYMRDQGITGGLLPQHVIAAAMVVYLLCATVVMMQASGRLTVPMQRTLVALDLVAMVVGVPHDPHAGLPVLFVYYMAFADLGLRYQYRRYLEALAMGAVALVLVALLRAQTELGLTLPDVWSLMLFAIIVLHALQVFAGRDQARRELQQAQERLQLALQSPGLGAWSTANPLHELKIEGHIGQVLGLGHEGGRYSMSDYVTRVHAEDRPRVIAQWVDFVHRGGCDYEDHYRLQRLDGEICTISSRAKALRDRDGRAISVSGMVWDLTEQKRQQEALQRMEERYRLATWSARVGVWIWHVAEDRFEHDDTMNRLFNLRTGARALRLQDVLEIVHSDDRQPFRRRLDAALASDASEFFDEVRVCLDDEELVVHSRATIYRDGAGRALRLAGANWDATKLAQARRALEEKTRELELSNRELDDFSYIASHDLKEPLRGIGNYAGFLQQDYVHLLDQPGREMLQRIRDQARHMETLIEELLNIARLGRSQLAVEEVDLHELLQQILQSLEFSIREKNVQLRMARRLPVMHCDRVRVGEVFRNLITNAIKYNDKPYRWVEVGCVEDAGERRFHVRDNGIGIRAEHHDRVFNPFERLHRRDAYGGGTGVGLTIVKKTVQLHGGRIWLDSEPGRGTTFHFTLQEPRGKTSCTTPS